MTLRAEARNRLSGLWGAYDFNIVRDKFFLTSPDLAENFLEKYLPLWSKAKRLIESGTPIEKLEEIYLKVNTSLNNPDAFRIDQELLAHESEVKRLIYEWAGKKLERIVQESSVETLLTNMMCKGIHYGQDFRIYFGTNGTSWKKKSDIAQLLRQYKAWSVAHAVAELGGKQQLYDHMISIVKASQSPTELELFSKWWELTDSTDRPMLFPQVGGDTRGTFRMDLYNERFNNMRNVRIRFDFGLVNVVTRKKVLIECDSRRYHSSDPHYQADRDRQNIAVDYGWTIKRYTYEDVMKRLDRCFESIGEDLHY
jgi:very-short-patch-repair endonuclease